MRASSALAKLREALKTDKEGQCNLFCEIAGVVYEKTDLGQEKGVTVARVLLHDLFGVDCPQPTEEENIQDESGAVHQPVHQPVQDGMETEKP